MAAARRIEISNQLISLRIQNVEDATKTGFPRFAKRMWLHLEHVLFEEILKAIRTNDMVAYEENQMLVTEISEAMKVFVHTIAKLHGLIRTPSARKRKQQEQQELDEQIGKFSDATWQKLVNIMSDDWGLMTAPFEEFNVDIHKDSIHTHMKHAVNREIYLGIFDDDSKAPDLLRDDCKNYNTVLTDMARSTRQKKEDLKKEIDQIVQKNEDMVKKNTLMDLQRIENIKKKTREMKDYNEETKKIATESFNLVKSSPIFTAEKGVKSIPKQLEIYTVRVNSFRQAQRSIKLNGYASSLPLMCTPNTYRQWKINIDLKKLEREPVPDWLKAGRKLKLKFGINHEKYQVDESIRSRLQDCDALIKQLKPISQLSLERFEASVANTSVTRPARIFGKVSSRRKKDSHEEDLTTRLCVEIDDIRQVLENLEAMVYNYLKDPITFSEKMIKDKCYK